MHERFSITQHLNSVEARLLLHVLLLAFLALVTQFSGVGSTDEGLSQGDAITMPDPKGGAVAKRRCWIEITGENHHWQARYLCADGNWATAGDQAGVDRIHVPAGVPVVFILKSTDYVYLFSIPQYGLREIAVPGLEFRLEFCPQDPGVVAIAGQRVCEGPNDVLPGELIVQSPEQFRAWLCRMPQRQCDHAFTTQLRPGGW